MNWETSMDKNEILMYTTEDGTVKIEVTMDSETVWLNLNQMCELFQRDKSVISRHIKNIFSEGELEQDSAVAFFATVQFSSGVFVDPCRASLAHVKLLRVAAVVQRSGNRLELIHRELFLAKVTFHRHSSPLAFEFILRSTYSIRIPIQRMTFTHMLFPQALYLGESGHCSSGFPRHGIRV